MITALIIPILLQVFSPGVFVRNEHIPRDITILSPSDIPPKVTGNEAVEWYYDKQSRVAFYLTCDVDRPAEARFFIDWGDDNHTSEWFEVGTGCETSWMYYYDAALEYNLVENNPFTGRVYLRRLNGQVVKVTTLGTGTIHTSTVSTKPTGSDCEVTD